MKNIIICAIGVGILICSFTGIAQPKTIGAIKGPYIGIDAGIGGMDVRNPVHSFKKKESHKHAIMVRGYGGYMWNISKSSNLKIGIEAGYAPIQDNEFKIDTQKWVYSGYYIDLLGVIHYNVMQSGFFLSGKFGGAFTSQTVKMSGYGPGASSIKNKILPKIAISLGYDFTKNLSINISLSHIYGKVADKICYGKTSLHGIDKVMSVNALTIGLNITL